MGYGINIGCGCRGRELMMGVGMAFPHVYSETMKDIKSGKYGTEMQSIVNGGKFIAVDAEDRLYHCEKCGYFDAEPALDLYAPIDIEKVKNREVGRWTAAEPNSRTTIGELGEIPFFTADDEDFRIIKPYIHVCPGCGSIMKETTEADLLQKTCPQCGQQYSGSEEPTILWD